MVRQGKTKILPRHHTGKKRPHEHTSYGGLLLVLLLAMVPLVAASRTASASTNGGGSYQTFAVVPAPTPGSAPTIVGVGQGAVFTTADPLTVHGSCPANTLVKVFKNEVLAGATYCQGGTYQVPIVLFVGANTLIARAYNANDAASPDSTAVNVTLNLPDKALNGLNPASQFYLTSYVSHRGVEAGKPLTWTLTATGGQPPYAISVSWGDGKTDLYSRGAASQFDISHTYDRPAGSGGYTVVVRGSDQTGSRAFLQLAAIVSGDAAPVGLVSGVKGGYHQSTIVRIAWQTMGVAVLTVFSFWVGEQREKRIFRHAGAA